MCSQNVPVGTFFLVNDLERLVLMNIGGVKSNHLFTKSVYGSDVCIQIRPK